MFLIIVNQILKMLLLMLVGYLCYKLKLIDQQGNQSLANLLLMVVNPVLAVMALQTDYNPHLVSGLLTAYLLAVISHFIAIVISTVLVKATGNPDYSIERFSCVYSNCGFMGIPLVQSILGSEGVLYITAYMTVFNILSWTHGVALMTGKASLKDLKKGLFSPMIFASILGLVLFFTRIRFPLVIADTLNYISGLNTPLAMMIAGVSVAQTDILKILQNKKIYFLAFVKLLLVPTAALCILTVLPVNSTVACTILIASACPSAATCTMFALRFQRNHRYASEIYALTTVCSLATIPLFVYAAERLLV
ncbi:MAG: AEC family transporter [Lachnospiraceae bacterium]|nr:AEC family transporter [Lachnospiraceae bacterium]